MKKFIIGISLLLGGCIPWQFNEYEPFNPTSNQSDLEFVRTGDKAYYYVIDRKRKICFFHARMYGHSHMTEIPCDRLPEYASTAEPATPKPQKLNKKPDATSAPSKTKAQGQTKAPPKSPVSTPPLTTAERTGFKRAYIQYFCARKTGKSEELDAILSRHGIDRNRYELGKAEFSADKDLWVSLSKEATEACQ